MTLLPIVERELRVASRKPKTYSSRAAYAGAAIIAFTVMTFILNSSRPIAPQALGAALFQTAVWLNFILCLLTGIHLTSDCISEEKREGTLGFLFLTDLKGYDVILGKLAATSMSAGYAIMAGLPVMAIPLLLGGVAVADFWRAVLVLIATLFLSLTVGIFVSSLNHDARRAGGWTFILILFFALGGPVGGYVWVASSGRDPSSELFQVALATSPISACAMVFARRPEAWMYWMSVAFAFGAGCTLLVLAGRRTRRNWQDKPAAERRWVREMKSGVSAGTDAQLRREEQGELASKREFRKRLLDVNAILWLTSRNRLKVYYIQAFLVMAGGFWFWGVIKLPRDWIDFGITAGFCYTNHLVLKMGIAIESGERFGLDMQSGALELLLCTRMKVEDILQGQVLALKRHFLRPVMIVLAADVVLLALARHYSSVRPDERFEMSYALVASMIVFLADAWAVTWVGMWQGLSTRDMKKASSQTVARVLVTPWIVLLAVKFGYEIARWFWFRWLPEIPFTYEISAWLGLSLLNDWWLGRQAQRNLRAEFRLVAMRRHDPPRHQSWWRRIVEGRARPSMATGKTA